MRSSPRLLGLAFVGSLAFAPASFAKDPPKKGQEADREQPKPVDTSDAPEPEEKPEFAVPAPAETLSEEGEEGGEKKPKDVFFGGGLRTRVVSLPGWLLGLFTKKNEPLTSYHIGAEFIRRHADMDFVLGLSFQDMSPPDGNWLGRGKLPEDDTDFVQFRSFGFVTVDAAFIWHRKINEGFGFHYGGGLGLAFLTGKFLRTSSEGCTDGTLGDLSICHPKGVTCTNADGCDEAGLKSTEASGGRRFDDPTTPSRFEDENAPPVLPVLNLVGGVDFHVTRVPGLEFRLDVGFFNAFFAGLAGQYTY